MGLFKVNEDKELVINRDEILLVKEFHKVITKDKGSARDAQGRKKLQAFSELAFIYFYCDYTSPYIDRDEKDKMRIAKLEASLEESWKPDEWVWAAVKKYEELQDGFAIKTYIELKKGLRSTYEATLLFNKQTDALIRIIDSKLEKIEDLKDFNPADLLSLNSGLMTNINLMIDIATKTNKALEAIEKYEQKIKSDEAEERTLKGGGSIGNREIPKD